MNYILLVVGFVLLIKGADFLVEGSSNIAKFFKIPTIVIGLTLVAFGTSAPEAAVSITASLKNSSELSVANIIGSNMINLLLILSITSLIKPIKTTKKVVSKDYFISIFSVLLLLDLIVLNYLFAKHLLLGRMSGIVLLFVLFTYVFSLVKYIDKKELEVEKRNFSIKDVFFVIGGLVLVVLGGEMTVNNAIYIAKSWGFSEAFIGLTIVAFGTSLPELCTSVMAAFKGENEIAIGNIIGSNIFNILFILGISSIIKPLQVSFFSLIDIVLLIVCSYVVLLVVFNDQRISRRDALFMLFIYSLYFLYIFWR